MSDLTFWEMVLVFGLAYVAWLCIVDLTVRVARRAWKGGR